MKKQAKQSAWGPGMEISSEAQYHEVTERLARELLQEHTPEQLALITAQHLIYVDALKISSDEVDQIIQTKDAQLQNEILKNEILLRDTARLSKIVLEAWKRKTRKKKMSGLNRHNESKSAAMARARVVAEELWRADTANEILIGAMADRVYRVLVDEGYEESLPSTAERLKHWIKPVAPEYARQGGRPRKTS